MKRYLASKGIMPFPTRVVSDASYEAEKRGVDVLTLSGAPIRDPPEHVVKAALEASKVNVIPPARGLPELREAVTEKLRRENGIETHPSEILITNGAMQALYITFTGLINPGDEVVMTKPGFFFYPLVEFLGGTPVYMPLREEEEFRFEVEELEKKISSKTKVVIVTTPENPTGYVYTKRDLDEIANIAERYDLLVISDESYEKMVYDGRKNYSIASLPGMKERTVTIQSFTKSYAMPGWRVGYIAADEELIERFERIHVWMVICCNYVAQKAAVAAMTGPQEWVKDVTRRFENRRDLFYDGLIKISGLSCVKPQGGPYLFPNISRLGVSSEKLASYLLNDYGVPSYPGKAFLSEDHLRIPFGATNETIKEALNRIKTAIERLPSLLNI